MKAGSHLEQAGDSTVQLDASVDGNFDNGDDRPVTLTVRVFPDQPRVAVIEPQIEWQAGETYRIRLAGSGASLILGQQAEALDGDYLGVLPSGNGDPGGDFIAEFVLSGDDR